MKGLKVVATLLSLAIAGLGLLGVVAPAALLVLIRPLLDPPALYGVAAARVLFGALLVLVAKASRMPTTLRVVGVFILVAGLATPFVGTERFSSLIAWLSVQGITLFRIIAVVPFIVGLFFVYAINSHRRVVA